MVSLLILLTDCCSLAPDVLDLFQTTLSVYAVCIFVHINHLRIFVYINHLILYILITYFFHDAPDDQGLASGPLATTSLLLTHRSNR